MVVLSVCLAHAEFILHTMRPVTIDAAVTVKRRNSPDIVLISLVATSTFLLIISPIYVCTTLLIPQVTQLQSWTGPAVPSPLSTAETTPRSSLSKAEMRESPGATPATSQRLPESLAGGSLALDLREESSYPLVDLLSVSHFDTLYPADKC